MADNSLFVTNINYTATADDLRTAVEEYCSVLNARIINQKFRGASVSLGIGFVDLKSEDDMNTILNSSINLKGRQLRFKKARPKSPNVDTAFIANLPDGITSERLVEVCKCAEAKIIQPRYPGKKGYGFLKFRTQEERDNAISKLNNTDIDGSTVCLKVSKKKFEKNASPLSLRSK